MTSLYALSLGVAIVLIVVVWVFFVAPLGKQYHERQLEMIRRKLELRERRQREAAEAENREADES